MNVSSQVRERHTYDIEKRLVTFMTQNLTMQAENHAAEVPGHPCARQGVRGRLYTHPSSSSDCPTLCSGGGSRDANVLELNVTSFASTIVQGESRDEEDSFSEFVATLLGHRCVSMAYPELSAQCIPGPKKGHQSGPVCAAHSKRAPPPHAHTHTAARPD